MIEIEIPHGGSGTGVNYWKNWADSCPIAAHLGERIHTDCNDRRGALRGTLVHGMLPLWRSGEWDGNEKLAFIDTRCRPPAADIIAEAFHLFGGYRRQRTRDFWGVDLCNEIVVSAEDLAPYAGMTPLSAAIDHIFYLSEADIERLREAGVGRFANGPGEYIYDLKTASAENQDAWLKWQMFPARVVYYWAAKALGYEPRGIIYEEVIHRKDVGIRALELTLPMPHEEDIVRAWLKQAVKNREEFYTNQRRYPNLTQCSSCEYKWICPRK